MTQASELRDGPIVRRKLLGTLASLALATGAQTRAAGQSASSRFLVAYFTRTGNTTVIAHQIRRALQADLFGIEPATPYPEDYEQTVAQAVRERDNGERPPLKANVPDVRAYDAVSSAFPFGEKRRPLSSAPSSRGTIFPGKRWFRSSRMAAMAPAAAWLS